MNIKRMLCTLLLAAVLMTTSGFSRQLPLKERMENEIQIKNYLFNKDIQIKGVFGGHTLFFYVDEYWNIQDHSYVELIFSQSEIKEFKNSTITVYLNDFPVKSMALFPKGVEKVRLRIPLPKGEFTNNYNVIKIKTFHRISDEPCTDDVNPANWLLLHKESYIHLVYKEQIDELDVKEYPFPYLKEGIENPVDSVIVIPDHPTEEQLTAAMILAADFGRRVPFSNVEVEILKHQEIMDADKKKHIIYIGDPETLPEEYAQFIESEDREQLKEKALIKEAASSYQKGSRRVLLVLSKNGEGLIHAVSALGNDRLSTQMKGNPIYLDDMTIQDNDGLLAKERIAIEDLGYGDYLMEGLFYQQATYGINLPKDRKLKEDASIFVRMRYSKMLDFDKSSVIVYLNDIPIGDMKLEKSKAEGDEMTIKIPKAFQDKNYFDMRIVFFLVPLDIDCSNIHESNTWAVLLKESGFYLPYEVVERRFLEYYPSPFISEGRFNDAAVVLPDRVDRRILSDAGNLLAFMGHSITGYDELTVITAGQLSETMKKKNLLLLGIPEENQWIRELNPYFYIKFENDFEVLSENSKIPMIERFRKNAGLIQIIPSPWNKEKSILVLSGTSIENLKWAESYLTDFRLTPFLKGDGAVIDEYGRIDTAYFREEKTDTAEDGVILEEKPNAPVKRDNVNIKSYSIFIIIISLVVIGATIFIIRRNR
ncbi:MAG: cellulose biosynthesis cyclic di-GMP-binding regulatory protein BcsB [Bacillota bacterium]